MVEAKPSRQRPLRKLKLRPHNLFIRLNQLIADFGGHFHRQLRLRLGDHHAMEIVGVATFDGGDGFVVAGLGGVDLLYEVTEDLIEAAAIAVRAADGGRLGCHRNGGPGPEQPDGIKGSGHGMSLPSWWGFRHRASCGWGAVGDCGMGYSSH